MGEQQGNLSAPVRLIIRLLLTIGLIYIMNTFLEQIFFLQGGLAAFIIIGSLITLMNVIVRPLLNLIMMPFKLFMGLVVLIVANGLILWLTEKIAEAMDPTLVVLEIDQGIGGWFLIAIILGLANWVMKGVLR